MGSVVLHFIYTRTALRGDKEVPVQQDVEEAALNGLLQRRIHFNVPLLCRGCILILLCVLRVLKVHASRSTRNANTEAKRHPLWTNGAVRLSFLRQLSLLPHTQLYFLPLLFLFLLRYLRLQLLKQRR